MAEQSTQSIEVDASPEQVMAVIADFPAYPEWAKAVRETEVLAEDIPVWLGRTNLAPHAYVVIAGVDYAGPTTAVIGQLNGGSTGVLSCLTVAAVAKS